MAHLLKSVLSNPPRPVATVSKDTPIADCVALMSEEDIGALLVGTLRKPIAILSERDIARGYNRLIEAGKVLTAGDVAFKQFTVLNVNDNLEKAMETVTLTKRRHVLVEDKGEIVGIISVGDLLKHLLDNKVKLIEHLQNYIYG